MIYKPTNAQPSIPPKMESNNRLTIAGLGNAASSNRIKSKVNDLWEGQRDCFYFRILWVQRNTAKKKQGKRIIFYCRTFCNKNHPLFLLASSHEKNAVLPFATICPAPIVRHQQALLPTFG
jgi:hypothetical protein